MDAQQLYLSCATLFSYRFFGDKHVNLLKLESGASSGGLRVEEYGEGTRGFTCGFGSRPERKLELTNDQLLSSEAWVLVPRI